MCLLLIAYRQHPQFPFIVLANRDEFYARATQVAGPWHDQPITAGRDLEAGGTWLGVAPNGRVAAVTNMREPQMPEPADVLSRGEIPVNFLTGEQTPSAFAQGIEGPRYRGFNTLLFDAHLLSDDHNPALVCAGNRHQPFAITAGVHGISNGAPDSPWPKVIHGCTALSKLTAGLPNRLDENSFVTPALDLLADTRRAPVDELPDTGVGEALESALSSIFVRILDGDAPPGTPLSTGYGTRVSSLVAVDRDGGIQFWEQGYENGQRSGAPRHFRLNPPAG
ncbi:NRDE family protein [Microbulbifer agarilyticus]|uniref:NRDE family protein n=1 Tax=Microbulbifer agarilyticus TaxID=260552 RepID=UPI001C9532F8|nr:NRDE family protein [Microbulbifer agarilyticus]MBY6190166.1 NRDE family protein [Microbulbifer agarilyticus]